MTRDDNKMRIRTICDALASGDGAPFAAAMADDFVWHIAGSTAWSGSYRGRQAVRERLLTPLFAQFATRYRNTATRILADEDCVVVECRGEVTTRAGRAYNNHYCWVIRMHEGHMHELTEYLDTALLDAALEPPTAHAG